MLRGQRARGIGASLSTFPSPTMCSRRVLDRAPPEPLLTFPELTLNETVTTHPDYQAAVILSGAGLLKDAAAYARRLNAAFRRDDAVALLAARASAAGGDYSSATNLMTSYFGPYLLQPALNLPEDFWALAFPRAYWPAVSAAAGRHNVDPLLMVASPARNRISITPCGRRSGPSASSDNVLHAAELDPTFSTPASMERLLQPE